MADKKNAAIGLGDRIKDRITGLKGIVLGITDWLYGCERIAVQPEQTVKGQPADIFVIDMAQAVLVEAGAVPPSPRPYLEPDNIMELGDRVKDRISGLEGVVIGKTRWAYGADRLNLQPESVKEGAPAKAFQIEEPQAILVKRKVVTSPYREAKKAAEQAAQPKPERPHGDRDDAPLRKHIPM